MLEFVPDQLTTKKMCKTSIKNLGFVIRYVSVKQCVIKFFRKIAER